MTKLEIENLQSLTKDQLIWLIVHYHEVHWFISETLVDVDKSFISKENVLGQIKEAQNSLITNLWSQNLAAVIDVRRGAITAEEYRKIVLGE